MKQTPIARNPYRIADWQQRSQERARERAAGAVRSAATRRTAIAPVSEERARAIVAEAGKTAATRRAKTGFSRKVKLAVRTRAGNGDPDLAMCEACGKWLGRRHGQVHHRVNRGAGGCTDEVINGPANAALLCGTAQTDCHGRATALDPEMSADDKGFWIGHGTTPAYDPRNIPVKLASEHGSGVLVYLAADGLGPDGTGYMTAPPEGVVAA